MVAPLAKLWSDHTRISNARYHHHTKAMLQHQCSAQSILDLAFMPEQAAVDFAHALDGVLLMWSHVANASDSRGEVIWNNPTKLHYLWHLGQKAMFLNPRRGNTMVEETYMGVCKTLAQSCLHSTDDVNMPKAFMDKYLWALHFMYVYGEEFHPDA